MGREWVNERARSFADGPEAEKCKARGPANRWTSSQRGPRSGHQLVVLVSRASQLKGTRRQQPLAPGRAELLVILQHGRAELVVVRIVPFQENQPAGRMRNRRRALIRLEVA